MPRTDFDPSGTLRVLGYDYEVRSCATEDIPTNDGTSHMGRALIRVDRDLAPDHIAQVALHEIVHAIDDGLDTDMGEKRVHRMARGLYAVCRDNPDYMRRLLFGGTMGAPDVVQVQMPDGRLSLVSRAHGRIIGTLSEPIPGVPTREPNMPNPWDKGDA